MAKWYDLVHLDRMMVKSGSLSGSNTVWTLDTTDNTLNAIVLGPDFGADGGKILTSGFTNSGGTVTYSGTNYTAGEVAIGRQYTMSIELSRPYYRDGNGHADFDAWLGIRYITALYHNAGYLKIKTTMPGRTDRTKTHDVDPVDARGHVRAWHNGNSELIVTTLENDNPKPCTVTAVEWVADYLPGAQASLA